MKSSTSEAPSNDANSEKESTIHVDGDFNSLSVGFLMTPIDLFCLKSEKDRKVQQSLVDGELWANSSA